MNQSTTKPVSEASSHSIYSKEMSVMMAGVAIILMTMHHFFNFPWWLDDGISWHSIFGSIGNRIVSIIAEYGNVCVGIFGLTSGYVLVANPKAYSTPRVRARRLLHFLFVYWTVIVLFLIVGALNDDTLPNLTQLLCNMFGISTAPTKGWINVPFAWYVVYYIEFILLIPVLLYLYRGRNAGKDVIVTAGIVILTMLRTKLITYNCELLDTAINSLWVLPATCYGIVIAKYSLFDKTHRTVCSKLPIAAVILLIGAVFIFKNRLTDFNCRGGYRFNYIISLMDTTLAPILMALIIEILVRIKSKTVKRGLCVLGRYSMYIWFLHGIFFTGKNLLQHQIYTLQDPAVIIAVCIIALLPIAYLLEWIVAIANPTRLLTRKP